MKERCWNQLKNQLCPKQKWIEDSKQSKCLCCGREFRPLIRRRHHCRFCGNIFCSDCSDYFINGNYLGEKQEKYIRHCQFCHKKIEKFIKQWTKIPQVYDQKSFYKKKSSMQELQQQSPNTNHSNVNLVVSHQQLNKQQLPQQIIDDMMDQNQYNLQDDQLNQQQQFIDDYTRESIQKLFEAQQMDLAENDMQGTGKQFDSGEINIHLDMSMNKIVMDAANTLCEKWGIDKKHWKNKMVDLAIKGALQTKMDPLASEGTEYAMDIARTIKIKTLVTQPQKAIQVIMKGIALQKNPPTKHAHIHLSKPNILIIQKSIDLDSLTSFIKFQQLIKNDKAIMKKILEKLVRLNPDIIFVEQNVHVYALQYLQSKQIIVISKLKPKQMNQIKQISGIKRSVKKLWMLEKYKPSLIIGKCDKIYFKALKQNQYMMFMEADMGIRTILLGQQTQQEVNSIKRSVQILLRLARQLNLQKHFILVENYFRQSNNKSQLHVGTQYSCLIYQNLQSYLIHQQLSFTKILYRSIKFSQSAKNFQQYGQRFGRTSYKQICGKAEYISKKIYTNSDITLGGYILLSTVNYDYERFCKKCNSIHQEYFYVEQYVVKIEVDRNIYQNKTNTDQNIKQREIKSFMNRNKSGQRNMNEVTPFKKNKKKYLMENKSCQSFEERERKLTKQFKQQAQLAKSTHSLIEQLNIKNQELTLEKLKFHLNKQKQLVVIETAVKCGVCGQNIGKQRIKAGKFYLSNSFHHIIYLLVQASIEYQLQNKFKAKNQEESSSPTKKMAFSKCQHPSIIRVYEYSNIFLTIRIQKIETHAINYINLQQKQSVQHIVKKQKSYIEYLYAQQISQKNRLLQKLHEKLSHLVFPSSIPNNTHSPAQDKFKIYTEYSQKLLQIIEKCQKQLSKQIQEKCFKQLKQKQKSDWTYYMRKILKIDSIIRLIFVIADFFENLLKKKKTDDSSTISPLSHIEKSQIVVEMQMNQMKDLNEEQENVNNDIEISVTQSISQPLPSYSTIATFDQSSYDSFIRNHLKTKSKKRYPRMQGSYLHFHTANINDPVGLLACGINSSQYRKALEQFTSIYNQSMRSSRNSRNSGTNNNTSRQTPKPQLTFRMTLHKILKTDSPNRIQVDKIYTQIYSQIPQKIQIIDITVYHPKQFQKLRMDQSIDNQMYVRGLCTCKSWDSSGGKSNSLFAKAENDLLVVKVINEKQFQQFLKFVKEYLLYMSEAKNNGVNTLLAKIFGIYQVVIKGKAYKCVVMENIFFGISGADILKVYDLKGSQVNRLNMPPENNQGKSFTGQDTNFVIDKSGQPYALKSYEYDKLIKILQQDSIFLKQQAVIDYSLLVIQTKQFLRLGIIDYMRPYQLMQKLETFYKQIKSGRDPTVIPPTSYAQRFITAMKKYFIKTQ